MKNKCYCCGKNLDEDIEIWKLKFKKSTKCLIGEDYNIIDSDKFKYKLCDNCKELIFDFVNNLSISKSLENMINNGKVTNPINHTLCKYFNTDCIHRGIDDNCTEFTREDDLK